MCLLIDFHKNRDLYCAGLWKLNIRIPAYLFSGGKIYSNKTRNGRGIIENFLKLLFGLLLQHL